MILVLTLLSYHFKILDIVLVLMIIDQLTFFLFSGSHFLHDVLDLSAFKLHMLTSVPALHDRLQESHGEMPWLHKGA